MAWLLYVLRSAWFLPVLYGVAWGIITYVHQKHVAAMQRHIDALMRIIKAQDGIIVDQGTLIDLYKTHHESQSQAQSDSPLQ